jgi:hypothetical protein
MKLHFIPNTPNATSMLESSGDESAVRAHAANILRTARVTGHPPRQVKGGLQPVWKLATGLLKLCL